jgi:CHASE3 domain sensor protein
LKKFLQNQIAQLAFGSAIAVLLAVGTLAYRSMIVSNENVRWVQHTHEVLENLQDLHFAMENIAGSVRGFILTGKESYLEHYRADILSVEKYATAVRNLTVDNPEQQRNILALEGLADERIKRAETNISLRRTWGWIRQRMPFEMDRVCRRRPTFKRLSAGCRTKNDDC